MNLCNQKYFKFEKVHWGCHSCEVHFWCGFSALRPHPCVCMERGPADLSRNQNCNRIWLPISIHIRIRNDTFAMVL